MNIENSYNVFLSVTSTAPTNTTKTHDYVRISNTVNKQSKYVCTSTRADEI